MNESHPTTAEEQIAAIRGEIAEAVHRLERHDGFLFAVMLGLRALQSQAHYDHSRFLAVSYTHLDVYKRQCAQNPA